MCVCAPPSASNLHDLFLLDNFVAGDMRDANHVETFQRISPRNYCNICNSPEEISTVALTLQFAQGTSPAALEQLGCLS
jgi:hypothetical protein